MRHTEEMAAVLACGGAVVVSHRSAAVVRDLLSADDPAVVQVSTLPPGSSPGGLRVQARAGGRRVHAPGTRPGILVHRTRTLRAQDVTMHDGIPVTTVARTLYDLARTAPAHDVEHALAHALDRRLIDAAELRAWLDGCARHAGAPRLHALLDADQPPALIRIGRGSAPPRTRTPRARDQ